MKIVGVYSFNGGREIIKAQFATELYEVERIITACSLGSLRSLRSLRSPRSPRSPRSQRLSLGSVGE